MITAIAKNIFSPVAWNIVCGSLKPANIRKTNRVDTSDLLASLADSDTKPGNLLKSQGVTFGEVMTCVRYHKQRFGSDLEIDPENVDLIFDSEGKEALNKAMKIASSHDKSQVTEDDLFVSLTGINDLKSPNFNSERIIRRIFSDSHRDFGELDKAYRDSQTEKIPIVV